MYWLLIISNLLLLLVIPLLSLLVSAPINAQEEQSYSDARGSFVTSATQNLLTVVSFLVGTSSFILWLSIQNISKTPPNPIINKYFTVLILALVIPSVIIIIYGIIILGISIELEYLHYLMLLFSLFVPVGAILFLLGKVRSSLLEDAEGQILPSCPVGYERDVLGNCVPIVNPDPDGGDNDGTETETETLFVADGQYVQMMLRTERTQLQELVLHSRRHGDHPLACIQDSNGLQ